MGTVPLHSPTMKLLLLLAALTTTTLAKPFFKTYHYFGGTAATTDAATCTLLFYPYEGWFSICPQSVRADGSAVPKPDLEGWQKLEEVEKLEELKLKLNEMATMEGESWY